LVAIMMLLSSSVNAAEPNKYLPNDIDWIVTVNVDGLLKAPAIKNNAPTLGQRYALRVLAGTANSILGKRFYDDNVVTVKYLFQDQDRIRKNLAGIQEVLHRVIIAGSWTEEEKLVLICEGRFDGKTRATLDEWNNTKYMGLSLDRQQEGDRDFFKVDFPGDFEAWFLTMPDEKNLVLAPSRSTILEVLTKAAGKKSSAMREELRNILEPGSPKQSVYTAGMYRSSGATILFQGSITATEDLALELLLTTPDVDAAKEAAQAVEAGLAEARGILAGLGKKNNELSILVPVLQEMKPSRRRDNSVLLKGRIPGELISKLANP
jgi:hypothetical protein